MKKLFIATVITSLLLTTWGCQEQNAVTKISIPIPTVIPIAMPNTNGSYNVYPPKIRVENINPGELVDEKIASLNIENRFDSTLVVEVYFSVPDTDTTDADTGLIYKPAPSLAREWLRYTDGRIEIPAQSILHIPVKIAIPKDAKNLPERWEFDLKVADASGRFISTALVQRWLITMR